MNRLKVLLVAAVLAVAVSAVAAWPAAAKGGNDPKAHAAEQSWAHGTTSQGKPIRVSETTARFVRLRFVLAVSSSDGATYEDVATMRGPSTPYVSSDGGHRLITRVRYGFAASRTAFVPTSSGIITGPLQIRVAGVIRVLAGTHLKATGTI